MGTTLVLASFARTWLDITINGEVFLSSALKPHEFSLLEAPANLSHAQREVATGSGYLWPFDLGNVGVEFQRAGRTEVRIAIWEGKPLSSTASALIPLSDFESSVRTAVKEGVAAISANLSRGHSEWVFQMWKAAGIGVAGQN